MGQAAMVASAIAGITQAVGAVMSAQAEARAYERQARIAELNAQLAEQQAKDAVSRGLEEEARLREQGRQFVGSQRAALAASGVSSASGSAEDVLSSSFYGIERDAAAIRLNAEREQWAHLVERANQRNLAGQYTGAASAARKAGWLQAGTTLLTTAVGVNDRWVRMFPNEPLTPKNFWRLAVKGGR